MNYRRQCGEFEFEEDPFAENFQGTTKIYLEVILLKNFLHTTPQVKSMNVNCHDL